MRALLRLIPCVLLACGAAEEPAQPPQGQPQQAPPPQGAPAPQAYPGQLPAQNGPNDWNPNNSYGQLPRQPVHGTPGALAPACTSDAQCASHRCSPQVGRCIVPCATDYDCKVGFQCVGVGPAALCLLKP